MLDFLFGLGEGLSLVASASVLVALSRRAGNVSMALRACMRVFVPVISAIALLHSHSVPSQEYPSRPIRLIVPSAAGGGADLIARELANEVVKQIGQQVVVDNRPGASSIIGYEALKRASPDGYTFGYVNPTIASNPSLYAKLPYDWQRDFRPAILSGRGYNVLAAAPSLPLRSVNELVEHARINLDKLKYGDPGIGAPRIWRWSYSRL
jgi:tripartite-type tricarboxylate transporter receptor subunit TctC